MVLQPFLSAYTVCVYARTVYVHYNNHSATASLLLGQFKRREKHQLLKWINVNQQDQIPQPQLGRLSRKSRDGLRARPGIHLDPHRRGTFLSQVRIRIPAMRQLLIRKPISSSTFAKFQSWWYSNYHYPDQESEAEIEWVCASEEELWERGAFFACKQGKSEGDAGEGKHQPSDILLHSFAGGKDACWRVWTCLSASLKIFHVLKKQKKDDVIQQQSRKKWTWTSGLIINRSVFNGREKFTNHRTHQFQES